VDAGIFQDDGTAVEHHPRLPGIGICSRDQDPESQNAPGVPQSESRRMGYGHSLPHIIQGSPLGSSPLGNLGHFTCQYSVDAWRTGPFDGLPLWRLHGGISPWLRAVDGYPAKGIALIGSGI
jgi:hypothetical protein